MPRLCVLLLTPLFSLMLMDQVPAQRNKTEPRKVTARDMPRIPYTPAGKALKTFEVAKGFRLELVAAEPLVSDPVDACFDEFGRMFVAEMHGYPFSQEPTQLNPKGGGSKDAGIIRMLVDSDGDGLFDKSTVFADKISWPTSVCCYNGGVFVIAPQYLYYLKDTTGDNKADVRAVILSGFGRNNVQSVTNGLRWGLDNSITFASGRNPKKLMHRGKPLFPLSGGDLRFNPRTEKFEPVTGGLQFGHTMDDWGTRFVCSNSNHIQQVVLPQGYVQRNPHFAASGRLIRSIASDGASARVFRISPPEPWRIIRQKWRAAAKGYRLVINAKGGWEFIPLDPKKKKGAVPTEYPVGFFTSATGITIYRGDAYPAAYRGNAFVGDVGGNLVHRKVLKTDKVVYRAERADPGTEFLRSPDNWFRPVNFVNAPDGTLYVLDMYRETVEHPYSIPAEIKKHLHLTSGRDRGRIYRLVSPGMRRKSPPILGKMTDPQLVAQLASGNGWTRMTAQRLLWERQNRRIVPDLERLIATSASPLGRLHALYTLQGIGALTSQQLRLVLKDKHPRIRAHAVRLAEPQLRKSTSLLEQVLRLCLDESPHVRFQVAFTLGESRDAKALEGLARLAKDSRNGPEIQTAWLSSVGQSADKVAALLISDRSFARHPRAAAALSRLASISGTRPVAAPSLQLLAHMAAADLPLENQQAVLAGMGRGLARRGTTIGRLLKDKSADSDLRKRIASLFQDAARAAGDTRLELRQRVLAISLLGFADRETAMARLPRFLTPRSPQAVQRAAVSALAQQPSAQVAETLLSGWKTYSPQVRRDVVDSLLSQAGRTAILLTALENKSVKPADIERDKKQLLLKHPNAALRARGKKLFGAEVDSDRAKVVASYQSVLELKGNAQRGLGVFKKKCSVCHRVGETGHQIAPNLSSVQNKSTADLLIAILDPNREAQPNFNVYSVRTQDGRIYSGIIATETANSITLRRAEGKQDVILRTNIDQLTSTGVSLMPEGLEKDISRQDLADVLAFIKTIRPPASKPNRKKKSGR